MSIRTFEGGLVTAVAVAIAVAGPLCSQEAIAANAGYARFANPSDTIRILGNTAFPGVEWTYEMRIRLDAGMLAAGAVGQIVSEQRDALEDKTVRISGGLLHKSTIRGYVCGDETSWPLEDSVASGWKHIAWVRRGGDVFLYLDGVLAQAWSGRPTCTADHPGSWMSIGMFRYGAGFVPTPPYPSFRGDLDWIRISAVARYESGFAPPYECEIAADPQTTLLLKFNEPAGTLSLVDESPNHFVCDLGVPVYPGVVATAPALGNIEGGFPECQPACPADINQSGTIDAEDLAYVLFAWGMPGAKAGGADINGDAIVDANDLSLVLGSWGPCPN